MRLQPRPKLYADGGKPTVGATAYSEDCFLARYCERALKYELVPEQIVGRLQLVFGRRLVSHETIYRWIYLDRRDLLPLLRSTKHGYRRKRGTNARWQRREQDRKRWIWQRPEDISYD
jgi:IS30 family transposase